MKTITTAKWIAALVVAAGLTVNAQENGGGKGGQGGEKQRPTPEQVAKQLMAKHDANKDAVLDVGELTQALDALREQHKKGGGQGGQGGDAAQGGKGRHGGQGGGQQGGAQGGAAAGERPTPPPTSEVATKMIEKFSSDKKGLTEAELAKALEEHRANRGQHGGGQQGGGHKGGPDASK